MELEGAVRERVDRRELGFGGYVVARLDVLGGLSASPGSAEADWSTTLKARRQMVRTMSSVGDVSW